MALRTIVYQTNVLDSEIPPSRHDVVDGPVNQWRRLDGVGPSVYVWRGVMAGCDTLIYGAWVVVNGWGTHSTGTYLSTEEAPGLLPIGSEPLHLGQVGTARLPAELDKMPAYTDERVQAVRQFYRSGLALAHLLIREAFPEFGDFGPVRDTDDATFYRDLPGCNAQDKRERDRSTRLARRRARQFVEA